MNSLINPRSFGMVSLRDERLALGREFTNRERISNAVRQFRGPRDISDGVWLPALKRLGEDIRSEIDARR